MCPGHIPAHNLVDGRPEAGIGAGIGQARIGRGIVVRHRSRLESVWPGYKVRGAGRLRDVELSAELLEGRKTAPDVGLPEILGASRAFGSRCISHASKLRVDFRRTHSGRTRYPDPRGQRKPRPEEAASSRCYTFNQSSISQGSCVQKNA